MDAGGQPVCVKEFLDEKTGKWEFHNWDGCFAAGTPVWVASVAGPLAIPARSASECIGDGARAAPGAHDSQLSRAAESACAVADAPTASAAELLLPIESVPLGSRVSTQNPDETDYDFSLPQPQADTWRRIALTIHRHDGATVEIELLRPAEWVARSGLAVGGLHFTNIEELELRGFARVSAIEACPPLAAGDGAVVTGRYITRGAGNLVRVTLEDGSDLVGTAQHPIWSESRRAWTPLGELLPGEQLRGRSGPLAVSSVEPLPGTADVYNLEIHGQHVYAITPAGVLVHNATGDGCGDLARKPYSNPRHRPKYAKDQVEQVYENARQIDGKVYDPNTGVEISWDKSKPRTRQWNMGHVPGRKYADLHKDYMDGKLTLEDFLREYRDASNYRPEHWWENQSHLWE